MNQTLLLWHSLNILTKERYDAILRVFGSLEEAMEHISEGFLRNLGCKKETIQNALSTLKNFDGALVEAKFKKHGVELISIEEKNYPERLLQIADPPVFVTYRGDLSILDRPCISIVGTREMSSYGKRVVHEFVPTLVRAGLTTISGLALGIDAEVAEESLAAGGKTVAVLGHGLWKIHPKQNEELGERILQHGGLLLSEFPIEMEPLKFMFPSRNRIIAGLSKGTVVLEAPDGSGALITAELALEYNRDVFAVPGQVFDLNYRGCNELIMRGHAKLVMSPMDILMELGIHESPTLPLVLYEPTNEEEKRVLDLLTTMPQPVDDLSERTGLSAGTVGSVLTMLELAGAAKNVGQGMWIRC